MSITTHAYNGVNNHTYCNLLYFQCYIITKFQLKYFTLNENYCKTTFFSYGNFFVQIFRTNTCCP